MKNKILFFLLIFLFSCKFSFSQWTHLGEPEGGNCYEIERVGYDIWAATEYGVYTSSNEGATWGFHPTLHSAALDIKAFGDTVILIIMQHPTATVYNLVSVNSYDGGLTWTNPLIMESSNTTYLGNRAIMVSDSTFIVKGDNYYYSSTNYAQTWSQVVFPATIGTINAYNAKFLLCHTYNGSAPMQYYSTNGGVSWNFMDSIHVSANALIVDSTIFMSLFDSAFVNFIARSNDFGQTWDTVAFNLVPQGQLNYFNSKIYFHYS